MEGFPDAAGSPAMQSPRCHVAVVGGGPAGLAAAIALARDRVTSADTVRSESPDAIFGA